MADYGTVPGTFILFPKIGSVSAITSEVVINYLDRAESRINARISHLYTVPVGCAPPALQDLSETLAMALMLRRFYTQEKQNLSEWVEGWFKEVEETLLLYATGSATLTCSGGAVVDTGVAAGLTLGPFSNTAVYKPTFDSREMINQRTDPDRTQADHDKDT